MEVEASTFTRLLHSRTNRYRVAMLGQRSNPFNEFFNGQRDNKTLLLFPIYVFHQLWFPCAIKKSN